MVSKFIRGKLFSGGVTIGLIIGAIYLAQRFNLGERVALGARGLGEATGLAVSKPFAGIVGGIASGLEDLQAQIGRLGIDENFGCGVLRNCDKEASPEKTSIDTTSFNLLSSFTTPTFDVTKGSLRQISGPTQSLLDQIQQAQTQGSQSLIDKLSSIVNPEASSPTVGLYQITFKDGTKSGVLPLSQASIDFHRKAGNTVTRIN